MDDINLHFTGDMHAITAANNLLSAMIDNHIHQGNELRIDARQISWRRVMDMNDRALRHVVVGLGGKPCGFVREDGFMITVASEIMAILCLAYDIEDLKERFGRIVIGPDLDGNPVYVHQLGCEGAMAMLMKDAIKPNLVQTLEHTPAIIHGGPFANIAHGCNSLLATKMALKLGDITVTEAGFGADLGAENSLTSNAIMAICILTRLSLLLQSVPSRCMAASRKRNCPRKTSRLSAMGLRTLPNRSRICAALDCRSWLPSINSLRIHRPKSICSLRNAKATVWMSASTSAGKRWRRRYRHGKQAG